MNIYFDKALKKQFLESQKISTDVGGYLVDTQTHKRLKDSNQQLIKARDFVGYRKGSRILLSKDIATIINEAKFDKVHERTR